ncbi:MAG: T9SS type A sorting domain-containing protein, partial [Bacteroidales bacterium]|nr:T9SS type A sorting domain-containing protein [Bacteroidales bacterium]
YDIQGKKVFDLTTNNKKGGNNLISWNACDFSDNQVKPGTYFALVKIDEEYYKTIKLIKH